MDGRSGATGLAGERRRIAASRTAVLVVFALLAIVEAPGAVAQTVPVVEAAKPAPAAGPVSLPVLVSGVNWVHAQDTTTGARGEAWELGSMSMTPLSGDWDGDGEASPGTFMSRGESRHGLWQLYNDEPPVDDVAFDFGWSTDIPIVGDWDGDGIDTVGVIRDGRWLLRNSNRAGGHDAAFVYGRVPPRGDDIPMVGDWDGDDNDEIAVIRDGVWYLRDKLAGGPADRRFVYGRVGPRGNDVALMGDWDGDGKDTVGVVRGDRWLLRDELAGGSADRDFRFGPAWWKIVHGGFGETTQRSR